MSKLTQREAEVMNLVANGLNNKEISEKLCISNHTTKAHLSSIYRKLGTNNRVLVARQNFELKYDESLNNLEI